LGALTPNRVRQGDEEERMSTEPTNYALAESLDNLASYMTRDGYTDGQVADMRAAALRLRSCTPEKGTGGNGSPVSPTPESVERPLRRRVAVLLQLGADSWEDVERAFTDMATRVALGEMRGVCTSGGYSWGFHYEASEDESVTHDSYFAALTAWLDREREGCR
jgi:hypothetical protein